jgi:hypothetical protein
MDENRARCRRVPKVRVWSTGIVVMAMAALCETRIRYTRLLVHLFSGDLTGGVEEGGDSCGRHFPGVVDLVQSTFVIGLVLEDFNSRVQW